MKVNEDYFVELVKEIMAIDSPSGFTNNAMIMVKQKVEQLGYSFNIKNNGVGEIIVKGTGEEVVGVSAHLDTLGFMVRSINSDGTLRLAAVGGPIVSTVNGEYCNIHTRDGRVYTGTILSNSPAVHVYPDSKTIEQSVENIHVRIDENVTCKDDVVALGICNGDFVCYDTKTVMTSSGYLKSRFLDDKLSVAIIIYILKYLKEENIKLSKTVKFYISNYEEVGHGLSHIDDDITELLAVDMGCIGLDLDCTEKMVSICAKDASGPYDYDFTSKLINIAKENKLEYAVDLYPMYSSDASVAVRAGYNIKTALVGSGIHASHGMERTHIDGVNNTVNLIVEYLKQ